MVHTMQARLAATAANPNSAATTNSVPTTRSSSRTYITGDPKVYILVVSEISRAKTMGDKIIYTFPMMINKKNYEGFIV